MPKYFINYEQKGGIDSNIIMKVLNDNHNLIWGLLFSYMPEFFTYAKVSDITRNFPTLESRKKHYETRCTLTSEMILYFLSNDKDALINDLQSQFRNSNDNDNSQSVGSFFNMVGSLYEENNIEEVYLIWLTNRPGYYSLDHQFIIHKKNNRFNIYQSWVNEKTFCEISKEQEERLYDLDFNQLNVILLEKLQAVLIPTEIEGTLQPFHAVDSAVEIKAGMKWSQEDHQVFGDIPGFFTHDYNDQLIKPIFVFSKDDITQTDNDNLQIFLRYCMEKIQEGVSPNMDYFQGQSIEEINNKISEILLSFLEN